MARLARALLAGFLLAGLYGAALLISGRATRKQHIPFGPFMVAGGVPRYPCAAPVGAISVTHSQLAV